MPVPFGFLCLDKPLLDTSHDLVYQVRRGTRIKRIGHAGTLDPLATGVLVLAIGAATRLIEYVMASQKTYLATIRLGQQTPSYDAETQVIATAEIHHLTERDIQAALKHFEGEVEQIPPMHSAVWHNGQRLYDLARRGEVVEREARRVWMQPRLISYHPPDAHIEVICSPGTYIRTLAHDLGQVLGVGAYLAALRRTASGGFTDPVAWADFHNAMEEGTWARYLRSEREALPEMPEIHLDADQTFTHVHGNSVSVPACLAEDQVCRVYAADGRFIAVSRFCDGRLLPQKVFPPEVDA
ncbi:MAG: tRNA pseudouridine(55) synthase TruB [Anaerolineae bacterium]